MSETLAGLASPSTIKTIFLQLALNPITQAAPQGHAQNYVLTAPVNDAGYLDFSGVLPRRWPVHRLGGPGDGDIGWLAHRGDAWFIDYDPKSEADDEPIFRLSDHRFIVGEYVTITRQGGAPLTYRVARVDALA